MSQIEQTLRAIIDGTEYTDAPQSRIEAILYAMANDLEEIPPPYTGTPLSRIEELLVQIKEKGGGSGDSTTLDALIDRSLTSINNNRVTSIGSGAFENCTYLTTAVFPSALRIGGGAFTRCSGLTTTFFPLVTIINGNAFNACTRLAAVDFPLAAGIDNRAFIGCTSLTVCILRAQSVCTLTNADAFISTPIANGTGYIYVPDNLVNDYKAATNWTVYAEQIKGLSQLPEGE